MNFQMEDKTRKKKHSPERSYQECTRVASPVPLIYRDKSTQENRAGDGMWTNSWLCRSHTHASMWSSIFQPDRLTGWASLAQPESHRNIWDFADKLWGKLTVCSMNLWLKQRFVCGSVNFPNTRQAQLKLLSIFGFVYHHLFFLFFNWTEIIVLAVLFFSLSFFFYMDKKELFCFE